MATLLTWGLPGIIALTQPLKPAFEIEGALLTPSDLVEGAPFLGLRLGKLGLAPSYFVRYPVPRSLVRRMAYAQAFAGHRPPLSVTLPLWL